MALAIGSEVLVLLVDGGEEFGTVIDASPTGVVIRTDLGVVIWDADPRVAEVVDVAAEWEEMLASPDFDEAW